MELSRPPGFVSPRAGRNSALRGPAGRGRPARHSGPARPGRRPPSQAGRPCLLRARAEGGSPREARGGVGSGRPALTVVVVADFLLAASLTVRHRLPGRRRLPAPPPAAAASAAAAARREEKRAGGQVGLALPRRRAGGARERSGRREGSGPPGRGPESAEPGAAAPTRDTGEGEGAVEAPPAVEGGGRVHCASAGEAGTWLQKQAASGSDRWSIRGLSNLWSAAACTVFKREEKASLPSAGRARQRGAGRVFPPRSPHGGCAYPGPAQWAPPLPGAAVWTPPRRPTPSLPHCREAPAGGRHVPPRSLPLGLQELRGPCLSPPRVSHLVISFFFFCC